MKNIANKLPIAQELLMTVERPLDRKTCPLFCPLRRDMRNKTLLKTA